MALTDMPLAQLRRYRSPAEEPDGFDGFWRDTVAAARRRSGRVVRAPADTPVRELLVDDMTFPGFDGEPVRAWLSRPRPHPDAEADRPLPAVIEYNGYGGGRGLPHEHVRWALAGAVHVFMDTRGQGSGWGSGGGTPDPHGSEPAVPGSMTRGILDPGTYYYRRLFTDAVRLVDAVSALPFVDAGRIAVTGSSQGGGTALAAAALARMCAADGLAVPSALMPDVAFLCDFRHSVEVALGAPYTEIARYLAVHRADVERVFHTLGYFDGVHFARRVTAPALFSVALMDEIVPPSGVFAAYNALSSADREMAVYPFNGHEGGGAAHWPVQAAWLAERLRTRR